MPKTNDRTTPSRRRPYQRLTGCGLNGLNVLDERYCSPAVGQIDRGTDVSSCHVEVVFKEIRQRLIEYIGDQVIRLGEGNLAVVGCVAWLTDQAILSCLVEHGVQVSIIVNKEREYHSRPLLEQLRPFWLEEQRTRYPQLWHRIFETLPNDKGEDWTAIRCCGEMPRAADRQGDRSLMHDKFLVFIECVEGYEQEADGPGSFDVQRWTPFAVWSGSANLTTHSSRHLENAVLITSERIADAYWGEWGDIALLSEPLHSVSPTSAPSRSFR